MFFYVPQRSRIPLVILGWIFQLSLLSTSLAVSCTTPLILLVRTFMSSFKRFRAANLPPILALKILQFLGPSVSRCQIIYVGFSGDVSSSARVPVLLEPVVVAAYVGPWECAGVCLVDAGFKTSWSEYIVSLIVYFSIR